MTGVAIATETNSLSSGELYMYLADKTQHRSGWQIFYSNSGRLQALRNEQCDNGKWSTTEEGELCCHVTTWGERSCKIYLHDDESVTFVRDEEKRPAPEIIEGNTTNCPPVFFGSTAITGIENFGDGFFLASRRWNYCLEIRCGGKTAMDCITARTSHWLKHGMASQVMESGLSMMKVPRAGISPAGAQHHANFITLKTTY
jgi:hypothetical protein